MAVGRRKFQDHLRDNILSILENNEYAGPDRKPGEVGLDAHPGAIDAGRETGPGTSQGTTHNTVQGTSLDTSKRSLSMDNSVLDEQSEGHPEYQSLEDQPNRENGQPVNQKASQPEGQSEYLAIGQPEGQPASQSNEQQTSSPHKPTTQFNDRENGQPVNQKASQPESQSRYQMHSQPEGQPASQPKDQTNELQHKKLHKSIVQFDDRQNGQPASQPPKRPESQSEYRPEGQLKDQAASQRVSQSANLPASRPVSQPASQSGYWMNSQPYGQPTSQFDPNLQRWQRFFISPSIGTITVLQRNILAFLYLRSDWWINYPIIAKHFNWQSWQPARSHIRALEGKGLITRNLKKDGFNYSISPEVIQAFKVMGLDSQPASQPESQSGYWMHSQPEGQPASQPNYTKVVVSSSQEELQQARRMTWEDFEELCPKLLSEGYSKTNFEIVIRKWETLIATGYKLSWDLLAESYRRAEWDADPEHNPEIKSPVAHTFAILQRGPYGKPKGYVDPILEALKERVAEIEETKKLREQIAKAECDEWWEKLSRDEKNNAIKELVKFNKAYQQLPPKSQGDIRFEYWLENVRG